MKEIMVALLMNATTVAAASRRNSFGTRYVWPLSTLAIYMWHCYNTQQSARVYIPFILLRE